MKVRLRGVYRGGAWVECDGVSIGNVMQTDEGLWWASVPNEDGESFDIIGEYWRRREAVAALVAQKTRKAPAEAGADLTR
jgi:hypothetical protein